ncbi:hypothetical protein Tco_0691327 [Tanacetum coccineum]
MEINYVATVEEEVESVEATLIRKKRKSVMEELTTSITPSFEVPPQSSSKHSRQLHGEFARMSKRHVLVAHATNQIFKENIPWIKQDAVQKEHASTKMQLAYADMMRSQYQDLTPQVLKKIALVYQGCIRDPNVPERQSGRSVDKMGRSCVIWERVHDFQLGIESYQIKVNLTTPTITFPGIETLPMYSVIADPFVGIVYENNKKERMDMHIDELQKFSYDTLKRVVKKISAINVQARHKFKDPPLNEKDKELMVVFEEEIEELLKYRKQLRRWESFVNGRPIQNYRERSV